MQIFYFIFLIVLSSFFSGSETAFISLDKLRLRQLENVDHPGARNVLYLLRDPHKFLITVLIGNSLVNIASSSLFADIFYAKFGESGVAFSIIIMTAILLICGEVAPKVFAAGNPETVSLFVSFPLRGISVILTPIRYVLTNIAYNIVSAVGIDLERDQHQMTEEDIRRVFSMGKKKGVVKKKEKDMIDSIFQFKQLNAADIMTPRIDIVALDLTEDEEVLIRLTKGSGYSRLPVFMHSLDNIVGIVHVKNFLLDVEVPIKEFVHRPLFAPESMRIDDLLQELQARKEHMAIITDEYGVTSGLVTIEDILEEIVGEIKDEHDFEEPKIRRIDQKTFLINGQAHIDDVNEQLGMGIDTEEVDTIGGYFILKAGRIPQAGDSFEENSFKITVNDVSNNRVTLLTFERNPEEQE